MTKCNHLLKKAISYSYNHAECFALARHYSIKIDDTLDELCKVIEQKYPFIKCHYTYENFCCDFYIVFPHLTKKGLEIIKEELKTLELISYENDEAKFAYNSKMYFEKEYINSEYDYTQIEEIIKKIKEGGLE